LTKIVLKKKTKKKKTILEKKTKKKEGKQNIWGKLKLNFQPAQY
jgi:hypothetical protein